MANNIFFEEQLEQDFDLVPDEDQIDVSLDPDPLFDDGARPRRSRKRTGILIAGGCAVLALAASTDYHAIGVLIICTLYLTRADRKRQCLAGAVLFLFELTAPLAFVLVWFYNGQRGACSPLLKKAFYWFYPVHLLVLAMITNLML